MGGKGGGGGGGGEEWKRSLVSICQLGECPWVLRNLGLVSGVVGGEGGGGGGGGAVSVVSEWAVGNMMVFEEMGKEKGEGGGGGGDLIGVEDRMLMCYQIVKGLAFLHRSGVIHGAVGLETVAFCAVEGGVVGGGGGGGFSSSNLHSSSSFSSSGSLSCSLSESPSGGEGGEKKEGGVRWDESSTPSSSSSSSSSPSPSSLPNPKWGETEIICKLSGYGMSKNVLPNLMSPEMMMNLSCDPTPSLACDVWNLGVCFFFSLSLCVWDEQTNKQSINSKPYLTPSPSSPPSPLLGIDIFPPPPRTLEKSSIRRNERIASSSNM